ncbi:phage baseplate upper protein [Enterococcus faecium]|uniref:BppU family phage baseplate upper protein n=2 Tax=Bacteria TaxID=2 RepID=UPI001B378015|nr:BppU family phage baseplate upper protein [Enterococcus lactis]ELI7155604.1 phage baseplate upper protein [Enterococcus faecium]MBQ0860954.1 phage baseplate upper protein [Enterococcus lactis]NTQ10202.1 phage baseplate upper protein [Enterococcus faecium]HAQ4447806.1 phage baseplate upper protein [Enterococcus faecium]
MADRKVGEITVPTEPVSRATKITGFTFKSYDKNAGVLQFNIENQDGSPTDLIDATVRLFMYIYQGEEKKEFPIFDNQIITESYMQGIVKYRIPDMLLSYEGKVDANVYIDFPDGSHTDNLAFTFTIEKSIIDDNVQLNGEYYFKDFQQLLDGVKQEATDAVNAALTNIDTVSQNVTSAQNNLKAVEDKMNQTNQQIGDLGKLKKMYSNSIDFGDYDYSGRPNLFLNLDFSKLSRNASAITEPPAYVKDGGSHFVLDFSDPSANGVDRHAFIPAIGRLEKGATYIATVPIMISDDFSTAYGASPIYPYCVSANNVETRVTSLYPDNSCRGKWGFIKKTFTVPANASDGEFTYFKVYSSDKQVGKLYIGYDIKIEKVTSTSDTATPYQPNLLDAPYYLSKVALGENIADPAVKFPISSSSEGIYSKNALEDFVLGETYTVTIGATKPASQTIRVYLAQKQFSDFKPVEGLVDTWVATVSITQLGENTKGVYLFQTPNTSLGSCTIKWLKIEKGDTRTPNISEYKYFGEGLKDSNNPNDYSWDITPEYAEKGLNNTVSLTEPQSVEGLKNFEDGLQIAGEEVATVAESTGWLALTLVDGFEVAENNPPQYKITYQANGDNEIEFRGEFQLTGGTKFTKDTSYYPFGRANQATNIPNELKPDRTAFGYGATSTGVGGRLAVTTTPNFVFIPGDSDGTYCSISPLRYTQTKK